MSKIDENELEITIWNDKGKIVVQEKIKAFMASDHEIKEMVKLIESGTPAYLAAQIVVQDIGG